MPDPAIIALHESKVVLILTPKAGSSSILRSLLEEKGVVTDRAHSTKHFHYLNFDELPDYSDYTNLLICREPFERFVSAYTNKVLKTHKGYLYRPLAKYGIKYQYPIDIFFNAIKDVPDSEIDLHFRSQTYRLDKVSYQALKIEDIEKWWDGFCKILGKDLELKYENRALTAKPEVPEALKAQIKERYKEDYRLLGYEF